VRALLLLTLVSCGEIYSDPRTAELWTARPRALQAIYSKNENVTGIVFYTYQTLPFPLGAIEVEVDDEFLPLSQFAVPVAGEQNVVRNGAILPGKHEKPRLRFRLHSPDRTYDLDVQTAFSSATLDFVAEFTPNDAAVSIAIRDPFIDFELGRLLRDFTLSVRDETCATSLVDATTTEVVSALPAPTPLSVEGRYCARVSTARTLLDVPIVTRPIFVHTASTYVPPPIVAPAVVVPVFDLEIPDEARCHTLVMLLQGVIAASAQELGASITTPIELSAGVDGSPDCRHRDDVVLDPNAYRARVQGLIDVDTPPRVLMVIVSNVEASIGPPLQESLYQASTFTEGYETVLDVALLGTESAAASFPFLQTKPWTFALDPQLKETLRSVLSAVLPYRRYEHPADMLIPFFSMPPAADWFGFKVCSSTLALEPTVTFNPYASPDPAAGYRFMLTTEFQPNFAFLPVTQVADLEICTAYCAQPQAAAWRMSTACESEAR